MNYLLARNVFLKTCGSPVGEEHTAVIAAFDRTVAAQQAQLLDSFDALRRMWRFW